MHVFCEFAATGKTTRSRLAASANGQTQSQLSAASHTRHHSRPLLSIPSVSFYSLRLRQRAREHGSQSQPPATAVSSALFSFPTVAGRPLFLDSSLHPSRPSRNVHGHLALAKQAEEDHPSVSSIPRRAPDRSSRSSSSGPPSDGRRRASSRHVQRRQQQQQRRRVGHGVLAGVPGHQRRARVRGRRGGRHGRRAGGPPARHAPHPPAAARRSPRAALRRAPPPRHPPRRGPLRALPRHGRAPRLRRLPERDGVPGVRDPVAVAGPGELGHRRAALLRERGAGRHRHGCAADADPVPGGAGQDPAAAGGGGARARAPAPPPRPRPRGDGPGHPPARGPPRRVPRARGDRAPRRAGARRLLLDVRARAGAAAPWVPPAAGRRRRREPGHHARVRRPGRGRQLGLLLPAGRGQVPAAGAGRRIGGAQVPRRRRLLPEERPGGRPPRAVARPRHRRRARVRRQWRHLLRLRAGSAVPGRRQRPQAGDGGELSSRAVPDSAQFVVHAINNTPTLPHL